MNGLTRRQVLVAAASGATVARPSSILAAPAQRTIAFDLIDLAIAQSDALDPHRLLTPRAIDENGVVLGNQVNDTGLDTPLVASADGVVRLHGGNSSVRVAAFAANGSFAGRSIGNDAPGALTWTDTDRSTLPLPEHLAESAITSYVGAAHPSGAIAGRLTLADGSSLPLLWSEGSVEVLRAPTGCTHGYATSMLDNGEIGGEARGVAGGSFPIVWREGNPALLDAPVTYGRVVAGAPACSAHLGSAFSDGQFRATIWRGNHAEVLVSLPIPQVESVALGLNGRGSAVGVTYASASRPDWIATIWRDGKAHALDDLIGPDFGVRLISANAINASGQIAASAIWPDGSLHTVRLDPR